MLTYLFKSNGLDSSAPNYFLLIRIAQQGLFLRFLPSNKN